jgi:Protein kinase domain
MDADPPGRSPSPDHARDAGVRSPAGPDGGGDLTARSTSPSDEGSQRVADQAPLPATFTWAHLEVQEEIGRGGFGRVYRAWDPTLAREVALKIVTLLEHERGGAAEALREGRLLARVRHANVVTVYGAQQVGNQIGLWMELVRGRSLARIVASDGPLSSDEATVIGVSLCRALAAVHVAGLLHRDIKAHNVMREGGGRIVLMDFGAGRELEHAAAHQPRAQGTPLYMAPEVVAGGPASAASDIYSLGVLLYFLVTGTYPVIGRSVPEIATAHGLGHRRFVTDLRPDLPERFIRVVERALSVEPGARYQSAGSMLQDLAAEPGASPPAVADWGGAGPPTNAGLGGRTPRAARMSPRPRARTPRPKPRPPWWQRPVAVLATAGGTLAGIGFLGFVASMGLNVTLGRSMQFTNDSPLAWIVWGLRALIAPAVYMTLAAAPFLLARAAWRLAGRMVPRVRGLNARVGQASARLATRTGLADLSVVGQLVFVAHVAALAMVCWRFFWLLGALYEEVNDGVPSRLALLGPAYAWRHVLYGLALDVVILIMGVSWLTLIRARRRRGLPATDASVAAGLAVLTLTVLLLVTPYRILWHNEFERVEFAGNRCYITGERADAYLLYCADAAPPRNRLVRAADTRIRRLNVIESIFKPPAGAGTPASGSQP